MSYNLNIWKLSSTKNYSEREGGREGGSIGHLGPPVYFQHNSSDWHDIWHINDNQILLHFLLSLVMWSFIGFHDNLSFTNKVTSEKNPVIFSYSDAFHFFPLKENTSTKHKLVFYFCFNNCTLIFLKPYLESISCMWTTNSTLPNFGTTQSY